MDQVQKNKAEERSMKGLACVLKNKTKQQQKQSATQAGQGVRGGKRHVKNYFFYRDTIDIEHCVSLRYIT